MDRKTIPEKTIQIIRAKTKIRIARPVKTRGFLFLGLFLCKNARMPKIDHNARMRVFWAGSSKNLKNINIPERMQHIRIE
jgi:hypothetical protein